MSALDLESIRCCFEGMVPAILATRDRAGVPNVSMISQVHYVDHDRVALSYQFFNKTRRNVLETRFASVIVVDPDTNAQYRLALDYEETRTSGPLFEAMRAKLAGIAEAVDPAGAGARRIHISKGVTLRGAERNDERRVF